MRTRRPVAWMPFAGLAIFVWSASAAPQEVPPPPPAEPAPQPSSLADCTSIADELARLRCYDVLAGRPVAPVPVPRPPSNEERFGRPAVQRELELNELHSRLAGTFDGWKKGTEFKLENGQIWEASGDGGGYYPGVGAGPKVTIQRTFFGAYWMEVEGVGRKIKVRRIQ